MKKKTFFILFIIYFLCLSSGFCEDGQFSVFPANDSAGKWEKVMFGEKEVIATDKAEAKQTIEIDIPEDGCYQLYVRLYHEWRECCPFVYIKIVDSKYKSYSNCLFSETRWYMPQDQGRWEYRSPSAEPFWSLHKGRAKISFFVKAVNSCWENKTVSMEGRLFIDEFILVRVDTHNMIQVNKIDEDGK